MNRNAIETIMGAVVLVVAAVFLFFAYTTTQVHSVGGYTLLEEKEQDPQFDIKDERSVDEIIKLLKTKNFDPVFTDWRHIENKL